jgi:hypothetical protein
MKSQQIIRPTQLVAETSAILLRLAVVAEAGTPQEVRDASAAADTELRRWMEPHEASILISTVVETRQRCTVCGKAAAANRCVGSMCLWCARKARNEQEGIQ